MISLLFKKVKGRGEGAYICYFGPVGMGGGGGWTEHGQEKMSAISVEYLRRQGVNNSEPLVMKKHPISCVLYFCLFSFYFQHACQEK